MSIWPEILGMTFYWDEQEHKLEWFLQHHKLLTDSTPRNKRNKDITTIKSSKTFQHRRCEAL